MDAVTLYAHCYTGHGGGASVGRVGFDISRGQVWAAAVQSATAEGVVHIGELTWVDGYPQLTRLGYWLSSTRAWVPLPDDSHQPPIRVAPKNVLEIASREVLLPLFRYGSSQLSHTGEEYPAEFSLHYWDRDGLLRPLVYGNHGGGDLANQVRRSGGSAEFWQLKSSGVGTWWSLSWFVGVTAAPVRNLAVGEYAWRSICDALIAAYRLQPGPRLFDVAEPQHVVLTDDEFTTCLSEIGPVVFAVEPGGRLSGHALYYWLLAVPAEIVAAVTWIDTAATHAQCNYCEVVRHPDGDYYAINIVRYGDALSVCRQHRFAVDDGGHYTDLSATAHRDDGCDPEGDFFHVFVRQYVPTSGCWSISGAFIVSERDQRSPMGLTRWRSLFYALAGEVHPGVLRCGPVSSVAAAACRPPAALTPPARRRVAAI